MTREQEWVLQEKYGGVENPEFDADKLRLAKGEPVAYVIGWQPFLGLKIYLDSKPLIPRPETEFWVEQITKEIGSDGASESGESRGGEMRDRKASRARAEPLRVLDLCAGSGAIGCALLKEFSTAHVSFGEIEPSHEATILKNIRENNLDESRATIGIGDLFAPFNTQQFDFIAANPPYIPEARELDASVAEHEPSIALRAGEDGLELIRRIADGLRAHLVEGGQAWIECDSAHAEAATALFEAHGFTAEVRPDQFGAPRVIVVS